MLYNNGNGYNIASTTDGIDSNTTVLRIVKLYYTAPNLVSYQKVLNKSQNFSSRRKFSRTVFACREIKKNKVQEPPRSIYIYTMLWARAEKHTIAGLCDVYDRVKHKTRVCRERNCRDCNLEVTKVWNRRRPDGL